MSRTAQGLLLLGEIRGQLRELIHNLNGNTMKIDALANRVGQLEVQTGRLSALDDVLARLGSLETDHTRRETTNSLALGLMKSPALGWLVGAAITVWAVVEGKVVP